MLNSPQDLLSLTVNPKDAFAKITLALAAKKLNSAENKWHSQGHIARKRRSHTWTETCQSHFLDHSAVVTVILVDLLPIQLLLCALEYYLTCYEVYRMISPKGQKIQAVQNQKRKSESPSWIGFKQTQGHLMLHGRAGHRKLQIQRREAGALEIQQCCR